MPFLARSLANCVAMQIVFSSNVNVNVKMGSMWIGGGKQPDVGTSNPGYRYVCRPRNITTGAVGNPTPVMRYEVRPTRQTVILHLPSASYDSQIDVWDIFRYGGTVTSYRYIGSTSVHNSTFTDIYSDDAANGGGPLDTDNFEPWPSVGLPFRITGGD